MKRDRSSEAQNSGLSTRRHGFESRRSRHEKYQTLADRAILNGEHADIRLTELRAHLGDVFTQVSLGKAFTVFRKGRVVGTLSPSEPSALELGAAKPGV